MNVWQITACCEPLLAEALSGERAEELAAAFKVLADPVRLRLLSLIAAAPDGEVCACNLIEPVDRSQPTVSHHLSVLTDAGLLEREQRGRWAWYRVADQAIGGGARRPGTVRNGQAQQATGSPASSAPGSSSVTV